MQIGTTQSQSLVAAISSKTQVNAQVSTSTSTSTSTSGTDAAVLLDVGQEIDVSYANKVLADSLAQSFDAAFAKAGLDLNTSDILASGLDFSPEATANRIVEFSTSFFSGFTANRRGDEGGVQVGNFTDLIKNAVKEGFSQARDILQGIGKISGQVAKDIDATFNLVMAGIDRFGKEQEEVALDAPVPPPERVEAPEDNLQAI